MNCVTKWALSGIVISIFSVFCFSMNAPEEVPFELQQGHLILVKGSIGNSGDLTFLIDTGATTTLVNKPIAKKLKLDGKKKVLFAYGKKIKAKSTILHNVYVGATRFTPVAASIADLSALPGIGRQIDVIIGTNTLVRTNFTIDYESKKLIFNPNRSLGTTANLDSKDLKLIVDLSVHDQAVRLLIDSGAGDIILFRERIDDLPVTRIPRAKKTMHHLGSKEEIQLVQLSQVRLGNEDLGTMRAYLQEGSVQGYESIQGALGIAALGFNRVQFDFQNQQFSWE
jgi:predicted aspartyl protease